MGSAALFARARALRKGESWAYRRDVPPAALAVAVIAAVGLGASLVGVVTGGRSLVTVPVMLALKMAPRQAVATNMLAVTFLSLSGAITFALHRPPAGEAAAPAPTRMRWDLIAPLLPITLVTSWLG